VEQEVGEILKVVLGLQNNESADAIVGALGDMAKKLNLVSVASQTAKKIDGSEASAEWKASVKTKIDKVWEANADRSRLAHSFLQSKADGSVELVPHGKAKGKDAVTWSHKDFGAKRLRLNQLTEELSSLKNELKSFKYALPNFSLMSSELMMMPRTTPLALFVSTQLETPAPSAPGDATK
jgi:hypothetical protein